MTLVDKHTSRWPTWLQCITLGFAAVLVAAPACANGSSPAASKSGGTITVRALNGDYDTLDPALTTGYAGNQMQLLGYDRLLDADPSGKIIPGLASDYQLTPKGDGVLLHIKKDATCSDGTPVTPSVIKASLDRFQDPATGAVALSETFPTHATITADDTNWTVNIQLQQPFSDLLIGLDQPATSIICPAGLKDPTLLKDQIFGSGPWVLSDSKRGDAYTFKKRKGYDWGPATGPTTSAAGLPDTLIVKVVENETTAANLIETNQIQAGNVAGQDVVRLNRSSSLFKTISTQNGADSIFVNHAAGLPGADPQVRKAIFLAIDPASWDKAADFGLAAVSNVIYTKGMPCYDKGNAAFAVTYDQNEARTVLQQDGYTQGSNGVMTKDGKPLTIRVVGYTEQNSGPEYLQTALQAIGINVTVQQIAFADYISILFGTGQWDVTDYPYGSQTPSPANIAAQSAGPVPSAGGANSSAIENAAYNADVLLAEAVPYPQACKYWLAAERELLTAPDAKPMVEPDYFWFGNGVSYSIFEGTLIYPLSIKWR
jgi:peptide/nickel transport system substrate-binding protein